MSEISGKKRPEKAHVILWAGFRPLADHVSCVFSHINVIKGGFLIDFGKNDMTDHNPESNHVLFVDFRGI